MKKIIPVTDLQRQAAQILSGLSDNQPVIITQRGRASAVLLSARRYAEIEEDLHKFDDLELMQIIEESKQDIENGKVLSNDEVKKRLNFKAEK